MEKISGIVKASPRVMSVDLKEASPVRPGTPSFGRPEGVSSLREQSEFGAVAPRSAEIQSRMMDWRSKDERNASMAAEISNKFFMRNRTEAPEKGFRAPLDEPALPVMPLRIRETPSKPAGFKEDLVGPRPLSSPPSISEFSEDEDLPLSQPEGLFPRGSFIDRTA